MICFNCPTVVALRNILGDGLLNVRPPIQVAQIMVHLVTARMNRQLRMMGFTQNLPSQLLIGWNHQSILVSQYSMLINTKVRATPFGNQFLDVHNFFRILPLLQNNLL